MQERQTRRSTSGATSTAGRRARAAWLAAFPLAALALTLDARAQQPAAPPPPAQPPAVSAQPTVGDDTPSVRLEIRVFDGGEDVTGESRVRLFPRGQRTNDLPMAVTAGQPVSATVPVGFYDAQAIREKKGQVAGLRWAEQLLVQRYPDEYGRHLEVINFRPGYGALQIRPARDAVAQAKGWSAVAYAAGDQTKELGKAVPSGEDLVLALPGGSYDVKLTLSDKSIQWVRDVEVPADRTRLKTWSASPSSR